MPANLRKRLCSLPLIMVAGRSILPTETKSHHIMAENNSKMNIDPRYMKYNMKEVEEILDGAVQMKENADPMSLITND